MYYTYIIYSASYNIYYKGVSQSPEKRLSEHNNDESRYTAGKGPWVLVYIKAFESKKTALIEEKRLKALNRRSVDLLINSAKSQP